MGQQNQFVDLPSENPNLHLSILVNNYDIVKVNGVDQNAIHLCLFPFSLRDSVRAWLKFLLSNYITFWT